MHKYNVSTTKLILILLSILILYSANYIYLSTKTIDYFTDGCPSGDAAFKDLVGLKNLTHDIVKTTWFCTDYPPLHSFTTSILLYALNYRYLLTVFLINLFYMFMLVIFICLICVEMRDLKSGLIASIIIVLYPQTNFAFDTYMLDYPLMGIITMTIYFIIKSQNFTIIKWDILFAFACAYGMMIKDSFAAYIAGFMLLFFIMALKDALKKNYRLLCILVLTLTVFVLLIYPWYFYHITNFCKAVRAPFIEHSIDGNRLLMTVGLWQTQLTIPFFLILIFGIFWFIKEVRMRYKIIFIIWIMAPNIIVGFMPHWKSVRQLLPVFPAYAIISAYFIDRIITKRLGIFIALLILCFGIFQIYNLIYAENLRNIQFSGIHYYRDDFNTKISIAIRNIRRSMLESVGMGLDKVIDKKNGQDKNVLINYIADPINNLLPNYMMFKYKLKVVFITPLILNEPDFKDSLNSVDLILFYDCLKDNKEGFSFFKNNNILSFDKFLYQYNENGIRASIYKALDSAKAKNNREIWNKFISNFTLVNSEENKYIKFNLYKRKCIKK